MTQSSSLTKVALPYAEALFEFSQVMQLIDITSKDLKLITKTLSESYVLRDFLLNPLVIAKVKKKVLHNLFKDQISEHVFNFLFILVERRRIQLLESIVYNYLNLVYRLKLTTVVNIYSVVTLTDQQKKALENKLQLMTNSKKIELLIHIKPELIGGLIIQIGSKVIDLSITGQLNNIASYLNVSRI